MRFVKGQRFIKGHGTKNDFVLLPDLDDTLSLGAEQVVAICDRRGGIGADGIIRIVRDPQNPGLFFMDYRNADGSIAQMCGNGARVFARYLFDEGLVDGPAFTIATRAGALPVSIDAEGSVTIDMGVAADIPMPSVPLVQVAGELVPATPVSVPNPHAVVFVNDLADAGALTEAPSIMPADAFPEGVNVEFVTAIDDQHIAMRVFERGVGETQSCGTGACAAAWVHLGDRAGTVRVDVPGGTVWVTRRDDDHLLLRGPVEFVASGELTL